MRTHARTNRLAMTALAAVLVAALGSTAAAAPGEPQEAPPPPAKSDTDGDKVADDLEAALAGLGRGERVDVIVQGTTPAAAAAAAPSLRVAHEYRILPAFSGSVTAGQVTALAAIPWVTRVELDGVATATDLAGDRDYGVVAARDAGVATDGALDGDGVGICVIDTGIDPNHEQLSGRVVGWKDYVNARSAPYDDHGHGTHVAGIAAGDGTGADARADAYGGVARAAVLLGAKVLSASGSGADSDVAAAIDWCAQQPAVDVISMSLGSPPGDGRDAVSQAANAATALGRVVVVAAGNDGDGEGTITTPGVATGVVTVGAASDFSVPAGQPGHDAGLWLAGFSGRGPTANPDAPVKPDVVAPGVSVMAAQSGTTSSYVAYSGTSMATPFVAGVVALGLDAVPTATPAQVKAALHASAVDAGPTGADNDWGRGLVDARGFVDALRGAATPSGLGRTVVEGTVPDGVTVDLPVEVTEAGRPLGVSLRIDGDVTCAFGFGSFCFAWEWSPDLDAVLLDPAGSVVAQSQCALGATNNNCGTVGRFETLGVASAAAGTWTLRVVPFAGSPNNGAGGPFTADVFGAVGTPPPPPPPPTENRAPTADAGADATVTVGQTATLAGSGTDPDGDPLTYSWALTSRPAGSTAGLVAASATATLTADVAGQYVATLTVSDGRGGSDTDTVTVTATATAANQPPVADAGDDRTVKLARRASTAHFTLDGSGSTDPDGDAITFAWRLDGTVVGTSETLTQTMPRGTYTYDLVVTDSHGAAASDAVTITVRK